MKKDKAVIVIPTYNEVENIIKMIEYLFNNTFKEIKNFEMHLLIVDGNSPDKTADAVKDKINIYNNLHLIVEEKKEGIGAAYIKGFKFAIEKLNADVVIEFDGDFQHPPESITILLNEITNGYDYVIGSRNIKGGGYPKNWGFKRHFFSRVGGLFARFVLFFPFKEFFTVTDPTTGLKATRVKGFLDKIDLNRIKFKGFAYKVELLHKMVELNAKIKEIPLNFKIRTFGESKLDKKTAKEIFSCIFFLRLKDKKSRKFIKFAIVGFSGYIVNSIFLEIFSASTITKKIADLFSSVKNINILKILTNPTSWAAGFSAEVSIINNFILNNFWTFKQKKGNSALSLLNKFFKFNFVAIGAILLQSWTIGAATLLIANSLTVRQITLVFAIVFLNLPYNWLMYNKVIWTRKLIN